jgi:hypothetical protein
MGFMPSRVRHSLCGIVRVWGNRGEAGRERICPLDPPAMPFDNTYQRRRCDIGAEVSEQSWIHARFIARRHG